MWQVQKLLKFLFVMWAFPLLAQEPDVASGCRLHLQKSITTTVHLETVFPEEERFQVGVFFRSLRHAELPKRLMLELEKILNDDENLIAAGLSSEFRENIQNYVDQGGSFFVNMDYFRTDLASSIFTGFNDGIEKIEIPSYKLIRAVTGNRAEKLSLLSDIAHEIQHSISNKIKKAELEKKLSISIKGAIAPHMSEEEWIDYVYRSEEEAIAAERKFVPNAYNSELPVRYFPVLQALQSLLNLFKKNTRIKNLDLHLENHKLFNELIAKYAEYYVADLRSTILERTPSEVRLKQLAELRDSTDFDKTLMDIALVNLNFQLKAIDERLIAELQMRLASHLESALMAQIPNLRSVSTDLLAAHLSILP